MTRPSTARAPTRPRLPRNWYLAKAGTNEHWTTIRHYEWGGIGVTDERVQFRGLDSQTQQTFPMNAVRAALALHSWRTRKASATPKRRGKGGGR